MAVGLGYRAWINIRPADNIGPAVSLRMWATAGAAMALIVVTHAIVLLVVAAALGILSTWWAWASVATVVASLAARGHYKAPITLSVAREAGSLIGCAWWPFLVLTLFKVRGISTATLIEVGALSAAALLAAHCGLYSLLRGLRSRGWFAQRTLLIGGGQVSAQLASTLEEHPEYGLRPIGFLDAVDDVHSTLPTFGTVDTLRRVLSEKRIDRVVIAFGATREADMVDVLRACEDASVDIHVLPRLFELATAVSSRNVDDIWGFPLLRIHQPLLHRHARTAKRAFDALVVTFALLLLSPLYVTIALVVKLTSPGPIHFRQRRVGRRGADFEVLKFRTMQTNPRSDAEWRPASDLVTRTGRVLRRTGLDELPQLWNILRGDMSLVGPRPERPFFVEKFKTEIPHYDDRHRVPVGLTGLAQVHGLRGDTSIDERARLDNQYIENWSLWCDVVILFQTVSAVIRDVMERKAPP